MIAITLHFKSLEAARQALLEIPESALVGGQVPWLVAEAPKAAAAEAPPTQAAPAATSRATAMKPAASEKKTPASGTSVTTSSADASGAGEGNAAAASTPAPAAETPTSRASSVDYPTLQKAVFTLAGKSREAAAAVAASFGVKTFKDLPADKWAAAFAAVNTKLAELEGV